MKIETLQKLIRRSHKLTNDNKFAHFSYLLRRNRVCFYATNNMFRTHPFAKNNGYEYGFLHSETSVLLKSNLRTGEFKDYSLVNIRLGRRGDVLLSRPCDHCARVIVNFGIKEVYYSNQFGLFERMRY